MSIEDSFVCKTKSALRTLIGCFIHVVVAVTTEVLSVFKGLIAYFANERSVLTMCVEMPLEFTVAFEWFSTFLADIGFLACVSAFMVM